MVNNCFIKGGKCGGGFYVLKKLVMRILKVVYFGLVCLMVCG